MSCHAIELDEAMEGTDIKLAISSHAPHYTACIYRSFDPLVKRYFMLGTYSDAEIRKRSIRVFFKDHDNIDMYKAVAYAKKLREEFFASKQPAPKKKVLPKENGINNSINKIFHVVKQQPDHYEENVQLFYDLLINLEIKDDASIIDKLKLLGDEIERGAPKRIKWFHQSLKILSNADILPLSACLENINKLQ